VKLVSLDASGNNKNIGGDEYYVTYTDVSSSSTTLVAFVHDNGEGTYSLDFSTTPMNPVNISGYGNLAVHLEYTCGIGAMGQPLKDKWVSGRFCSTSWSRDNVTTPSYRVFSPPTDAGIDFSPYSMVVGYVRGLSHRRLVWAMKQKRNAAASSKYNILSQQPNFKINGRSSSEKSHWVAWSSVESIQCCTCYRLRRLGSTE
jgi:hypothetical protein